MPSGFFLAFHSQLLSSLWTFSDMVKEGKGEEGSPRSLIGQQCGPRSLRSRGYTFQHVITFQHVSCCVEQMWYVAEGLYPQLLYIMVNFGSCPAILLNYSTAVCVGLRVSDLLMAYLETSRHTKWENFWFFFLFSFKEEKINKETTYITTICTLPLTLLSK